MANKQILHYKVQKTLTKNKFGITYKCLNTNNNQEVILKEVYRTPNPEQLTILKKINNINHGNFLKSSYFSTNNKHYIVRDFFNGTDFKSILKSTIKYSQLSQHFFIKSLIQVLSQLQKLHNLGILHTDIKPSNIFIKHSAKAKINKWNPEDVMILDYERAILFPTSTNTRYKGFSMLYSPPEQVLKRLDLFNESTDIFAATISFLEILSKHKPLYDCNAEVMINLQLTYPIPKPANMDQTLFDILKPSIYKEKFKKPPRLLSYDDITTTLKSGINQRQYNSQELAEKLSAWLSNHEKQNHHWVIKLLHRIFIEKQ